LQQHDLTINDATRQTRARWREDIKDTSQQNGLTINDATRQARARILKILRHIQGWEQHAQPRLVKE
jgi:hypothetical protein